MSFRNRLTMFFVFIVIVPMIAVAYVLYDLAADSQDSSARTSLPQAERTAESMFEEAQRRAAATGRLMGSDHVLANAIRDRDRTRVIGRLERLAEIGGVRRLSAELAGMAPVALGGGPAIAPATSTLVDAGRAVGRLRVSVLSASDYVRLLRTATSLEVAVQDGGRVIAATLPGLGAAQLPPRGTGEVAGSRYRLAGFDGPSFTRGRVVVRVLARAGSPGTPFEGTSAVVSAGLLGFLLLALAFAFAVTRSLHAQIGRLLDAARRMGRGDFGIQVATQGNDEFAALGSEFNAMARLLESRVEELQQERARLQGAIRRVGESFAKGLDRDAVLEIAVKTAVDGVGADCGRATFDAGDGRDGGGALVEVARSGDLSAHLVAIEQAERQALRTGRATEVSGEGSGVLAQPLHSPEGGEVLGLLCVARGERPFLGVERELLNYLTNQAAVSIENIDLHQTVQRQAVTDELTGLFNHRRFQEVMAHEIERTRRFGSDMGLVLLDIDDFKKVNDTYGHMQGDMVLREVAQVLRDSAREIDEPARYGGEEMAVALPQTDLEGAYQFAERVRRRIEALELPILDGEHSGRLRVTASFGAAALPRIQEAGREALVAAADAALYEAKRSGKNRTVRAG